MGAYYTHISDTIKGVVNNVDTGFFEASIEEWDSFFEGGGKYKTPPGKRVGDPSALDADMDAHDYVQFGRSFPPEQFTGAYHAPENFDEFGYQEVLHTSTVTGEVIAYLKPVVTR